MINVVFLLLIFFLMTAQITPPVPFEVTPPGSDSTTPPDGMAETLHVAADGALYFNGLTGDAARAALAALQPEITLTIRADTGLRALELTRLLGQLTAQGLQDIFLVTEEKP